jgi:hypothetical protein
MDVFSLGYMMGRMLRNPVPTADLFQLIAACKEENPDKRPNLDELEQQLNKLLLSTEMRLINSVV